MFINYIGRLGANVATDGQQIASYLAENDSAQLQTVPILQGKPSLVDLFNLSETRLLYDWLLRSKTKLPSAINEPYPQMPLSTQCVINANCCRADRLSYRVTYEWVTHFAGKNGKAKGRCVSILMQKNDYRDVFIFSRSWSFKARNHTGNNVVLSYVRVPAALECNTLHLVFICEVRSNSGAGIVSILL